VPCVQEDMAMDADRYLTGVPINLFQPHVIVPAQHFDPRHTRMLEPLKEAAMVAGKLQGGLRDRARRVAITKGIAHLAFSRREQ
jgi:hypothetical protein